MHAWTGKDKSCPYRDLERPLGLQGLEVARISRQLAH